MKRWPTYDEKRTHKWTSLSTEQAKAQYKTRQDKTTSKSSCSPMLVTRLFSVLASVRGMQRERGRGRDQVKSRQEEGKTTRRCNMLTVISRPKTRLTLTTTPIIVTWKSNLWIPAPPWERERERTERIGFSFRNGLEKEKWTGPKRGGDRKAIVSQSHFVVIITYVQTGKTQEDQKAWAVVAKNSNLYCSLYYVFFTYF